MSTSAAPDDHPLACEYVLDVGDLSRSLVAFRILRRFLEGVVDRRERIGAMLVDVYIYEDHAALVASGINPNSRWDVFPIRLSPTSARGSPGPTTSNAITRSVRQGLLKYQLW